MSTLKLVNYSEKAVAVIGDTKPVKDQLKALGGKFNPHLKCGAGWIFSKKKVNEIDSTFSFHSNNYMIPLETAVEMKEPKNSPIGIADESAPGHAEFLGKLKKEGAL